MMDLGVYIQHRLFQRGGLVYRLRIKADGSLGSVTVGDILVCGLRWCCTSRPFCVKQMSSVLCRRSFYVRSEGAKIFASAAICSVAAVWAASCCARRAMIVSIEAG